LLIAPLTLWLSPAPAALAQEEDTRTPVQIVALDECDPTTFNAATAVGPDFCKNVALAFVLPFATTRPGDGSRMCRRL
jgi:hypothetical protein